MHLNREGGKNQACWFASLLLYLYHNMSRKNGCLDRLIPHYDAAKKRVLEVKMVPPPPLWPTAPDTFVQRCRMSKLHDGWKRTQQSGPGWRGFGRWEGRGGRADERYRRSMWEGRRTEGGMRGGISLFFFWWKQSIFFTTHQDKKGGVAGYENIVSSKRKDNYGLICTRRWRKKNVSGVRMRPVKAHNSFGRCL